MGSGVGDAKGGVVIALRAISMILAQGVPKYSIRVIVAGDEEVGSPGHGDQYATLSKDAVAIFGLEPSGLGNILHGRLRSTHHPLR
jgi:acetylornithine deacetylase/succinyl-diaminopimelate desuccinylase-like protein